MLYSPPRRKCRVTDAGQSCGKGKDDLSSHKAPLSKSLRLYPLDLGLTACGESTALLMKSALLLLRHQHDVSKSCGRERCLQSRTMYECLLILPSLHQTALTHSSASVVFDECMLKGKKWSSVFGQLPVLAFPPCHLCPKHLGCHGPGLLGSVRTSPHTHLLWGFVCRYITWWNKMCFFNKTTSF